MFFDLGIKRLLMNRSWRDFYPTSTYVINEIKIHYLHLNSITICNLIFGCFLIFFFIPLDKITPHHVLEGHDGSNVNIYPHTSLEKSWQKCDASSAHGRAWPIVNSRRTFGFWRGSEKPPASEMPATTNHSVRYTLALDCSRRSWLRGNGH